MRRAPSCVMEDMRAMRGARELYPRCERREEVESSIVCHGGGESDTQRQRAVSHIVEEVESDETDENDARKQRALSHILEEAESDAQMLLVRTQHKEDHVTKRFQIRGEKPKNKIKIKSRKCNSF